MRVLRYKTSIQRVRQNKMQAIRNTQAIGNTNKNMRQFGVVHEI